MIRHEKRDRQIRSLFFTVLPCLSKNGFTAKREEYSSINSSRHLRSLRLRGSLNHFLVIHFHEIKSLRRRGPACQSPVFCRKYPLHFFGFEPAEADLHKCSNDISGHVLKKSVSRKQNLDKIPFFFYHESL